MMTRTLSMGAGTVIQCFHLRPTCLLQAQTPGLEALTWHLEDLEMSAEACLQMKKAAKSALQLLEGILGIHACLYEQNVLKSLLIYKARP